MTMQAMIVSYNKLVVDRELMNIELADCRLDIESLKQELKRIYVENADLRHKLGMPPMALPLELVEEQPKTEPVAVVKAVEEPATTKAKAYRKKRAPKKPKGGIGEY